KLRVSSSSSGTLCLLVGAVGAVGAVTVRGFVSCSLISLPPGQPFSVAHCNTHKLSERSAARQVHSFHAQPPRTTYCSTSRSPRLASSSLTFSFHSHACARNTSTTAEFAAL